MPSRVPLYRLALRAALALACALAAAPLHGQQRDTTRTQSPISRPPPPQEVQRDTPASTQGTQGESRPSSRFPSIRIRPVTVPDVRGMPVNVARARLVAAGLLPGRVDSVAADARQGTVVAQGPAPGTTVVPGYPIRLTLARAESVEVPDLAGATASEAASLLRNARLAIGAVDSTESERKEGTVVAQQPAAGTAVRPGAAVGVTLASARLVTVPGLAGQPLARAEAALRDAGLRTGAVERTAATGAPDRVLSQSRQAGERVRPGTAVGLTVAIGTVAVPDLGGRALADARQALADAGLRAGGVDSLDSPRAEGSVVRQSPAAGTQVPPGSPVTVTLARAQLVTVPGVVGAAPADAARTLRVAGLVASGVPASTAPSSVVSTQAPAAGARVRPGSRVELQLAAAAQPDTTPTPVAGGGAQPVDTAVAGGSAGGPADGPADAPPGQGTSPPPVDGGPGSTPSTGGVSSGSTEAPSPEGTRIPWLWIVIAIVLLAGAAAAVKARRGKAGGGGGSGSGAAAVPPTVVLSGSRWDPGAPAVQVDGPLLRTPEVALRAGGDPGVQRVDVEGSLIAAEVGR